MNLSSLHEEKLDSETVEHSTHHFIQNPHALGHPIDLSNAF